MSLVPVSLSYILYPSLCFNLRGRLAQTVHNRRSYVVPVLDPFDEYHIGSSSIQFSQC